MDKCATKHCQRPLSPGPLNSLPAMQNSSLIKAFEPNRQRTIISAVSFATSFLLPEGPSIAEWESHANANFQKLHILALTRSFL